MSTPLVSAPAHGVAAGEAAPVAPDQVAREVERLRQYTRECALVLLERNWRAAARAAYRAAWSYHRLPREAQIAYVVSDLHDDDGPLAVADDWSASAFVAWLIWRCNRSIEGVRTTPKPAFATAESSIARSDQEARATDEPRQQKGLWT